MTLEKAKKMLEEEYEWAKKLEWVERPLAYALYHTWRRAEIEEGKKGEQMMKKYNITYYKCGVQQTVTITARNRREAMQTAWSICDTDDFYISEVEDDEQAEKGR